MTLEANSPDNALRFVTSDDERRLSGDDEFYVGRASLRHRVYREVDRDDLPPAPQVLDGYSHVKEAANRIREIDGVGSKNFIDLQRDVMIGRWVAGVEEAVAVCVVG